METHQPIRLSCGNSEGYLCRGRVCVSVFVLPCVIHTHTHSHIQDLTDNSEWGSIVSDPFKCIVFCVHVCDYLRVCVLCLCMCATMLLWMFVYVCGLCKMRMFPPRVVGVQITFKAERFVLPREQNVPGRVQVISASWAFQKPWCVLSGALWKEVQSCGFMCYSSKITEQINILLMLIRVLQRALAEVSVCSRDHFEQEISFHSVLPLSDCLQRRTVGCSCLCHSSARCYLTVGFRYHLTDGSRWMEWFHSKYF